MEARILKLQELSKQRKASMNEFEEMRKETLRIEEEKRKTQRIIQLIQQVPFRFREKTFSDYVLENTDQARIKKLMERYVSTFAERLNDGSCLIFTGKPGTGKTLLSLIIYQALTHAGYIVQYESSLEFIKNLLEVKFKSQAMFQSQLDTFNKSNLLIIDEVTESISKDGCPTEIERQLLSALIDARYQEKKCTIVISNRDKSELTKRLGKTIIDRLSENGITLTFNWQSYRIT